MMKKLNSGIMLASVFLLSGGYGFAVDDLGCEESKNNDAPRADTLSNGTINDDTARVNEAMNCLTVHRRNQAQELQARQQRIAAQQTAWPVPDSYRVFNEGL